MLKGGERFWFRGHGDVTWSLTPTALRYGTVGEREAALLLQRQFRRVAEIKLPRPPAPHEQLKWMQLAQHYGIPTRLLDWTESATFALYFACEHSHDESDGIVFLFNPQHLSRLRRRTRQTSLDAHLDEELIKGYFDLVPRARKGGLPTISIEPVWNSERLMLQRGVFTLHGSLQFSLDAKQAPSLVGIPVLKEAKPVLREELGRIGVDEMTIFPELEHACRHLKRSARLG